MQRALRVQPSILQLLPSSMRRLRLERVDVAAGDAGPEDEDEDALLQALGSLMQLQELETRCQGFEDSDLQHMSALTASSQLRRLSVIEDLEGLYAGPVLLPLGAMQLMFPAGRQLPHLRELELVVNMTVRDLKEAGLHTNILSRDVASMVSALPALDTLTLVNVLESEQALAQLTALSALTRLTVGGSYMRDKGVRLLAKLTTLQDLTVCHTLVTSTGLLSLSALRRCTRLEVLDAPQLEACVCNVSGSDAASDDDFPDEFGGDFDMWDGNNKDSLLLCVSAEDQARGVRPVWWQLRNRCRKDPKCRQALQAAALRKAQRTAAKAKGHEQQ